MDKIKLAKTVASSVVGFGASKVITQIIANNTAPESVKDKVLIAVGGLAIGGMIGDATRKYTGNLIDETVRLYIETVKPKIKEA